MRRLEAFKAFNMQGEIGDHGLTNHLALFPKNIAPNPIRLALGVLFPWSVAANLRSRKRYPGVYAGSVALLRGKAKPDTLKDWCSGRRNAPRWFVGFLDAELAERQRVIEEARKGLAEYRSGRGRGAGLRDWWRDKRYAEIEGRVKNSPHNPVSSELRQPQ